MTSHPTSQPSDRQLSFLPDPPPLDPQTAADIAVRLAEVKAGFHTFWERENVLACVDINGQNYLEYHNGLDDVLARFLPSDGIAHYLKILSCTPEKRMKDTLYLRCYAAGYAGATPTQIVAAIPPWAAHTDNTRHTRDLTNRAITNRAERNRIRAKYRDR